VPEGGVITLHGAVNHCPACGVPRLLAEIAEAGVGEDDLMNFPIRYGTAMPTKRLGPGR
jgi:hypothetical protein